MDYDKALKECTPGEWEVSEQLTQANAALIVHEHKHFKGIKDNLLICLELVCSKCSDNGACAICEVTEILDAHTAASEVEGL